MAASRVTSFLRHFVEVNKHKSTAVSVTELYILLESILQLEQRKILRPWNGRLASLTKMAALRPVFHRLPEPNRAWLLVVYFSR